MGRSGILGFDLCVWGKLSAAETEAKRPRSFIPAVITAAICNNTDTDFHSTSLKTEWMLFNYCTFFIKTFTVGRSTFTDMDTHLSESEFCFLEYIILRSRLECRRWFLWENLHTLLRSGCG